MANPAPGADQRPPAYAAFGEFVRTQRALAQLSLRQASEIARISNPYLSQIEHGWVLPSVSVMSKLAEAFSLSAETVLREAAIAASGASEASEPTTEAAIQCDPRLSVDEKQALLLILESFTQRAAAHALRDSPDAAPAPKKPKTRSTKSKKPAKTSPATPTKRSK